MKKILLTNARLVNEGEIREGDLLIAGERIARIDSHISDADARVIDLEWNYAAARRNR